MLNRVLLMAAAGMIAFGASAFTAPTTAEAHHRHGYSGGGIYLQFGHAPRYYRHKPRRHYRHYRHQPRYYRHHRPRYQSHCHRVWHWVRSTTHNPKRQRRLLRRYGC
ncbi:MAG: hypothetical protein AAGD23_04975 [Pseudomonadota bacterium]